MDCKCACLLHMALGRCSTMQPASPSEQSQNVGNVIVFLFFKFVYNGHFFSQFVCKRQRADAAY